MHEVVPRKKSSRELGKIKTFHPDFGSLSLWMPKQSSTDEVAVVSEPVSVWIIRLRHHHSSLMRVARRVFRRAVLRT